jgi:hypothetical protein
MTSSPAVHRWSTFRIGAVVSVATIAALAAAYVLASSSLHETISGDDPPTCDAAPVVVAWTERDGQWQRSDVFELVEDGQIAQIDVALGPDGGVIQTGQTVYVVAAGTPWPDASDDTPESPPSVPGEVVGRGIDAVNEQITLDAGRWQLVVSGNVGSATVRWPC